MKDNSQLTEVSVTKLRKKKKKENSEAGDDLVSKVLVMWAWGPVSDPSEPVLEARNTPVIPALGRILGLTA